MAFPWLGEENFETGAKGSFDASSDTDSRIDFPHFSELARTPGLPAPWRGAYCYRVKLAPTGGHSAYLQETGAWDTSAAGTIWFRFMLWVSADLTMADTDEFAIFQLWSGTNTVEATIAVNYTTANGLRLGVGETSASQFLALTPGQWHAVELAAVIDSGVGNDGTLDLYLDGSHATQVTALDQGAITSGVLGVIGIDAGTTKGTVLFDWIIADDAQIYPPDRRFGEQMLMTMSGHAFVGPGSVENITLLSGGGTDNVATVFDTDVGNSNDASDVVVQLKNTANNETVDPAGVPARVIRGAYVALSGTNPRALVTVKPQTAWGSDGAIRGYGARRLPAPRNV